MIWDTGIAIVFIVCMCTFFFYLLKREGKREGELYWEVFTRVCRDSWRFDELVDDINSCTNKKYTPQEVAKILVDMESRNCIEYDASTDVWRRVNYQERIIKDLKSDSRTITVEEVEADAPVYRVLESVGAKLRYLAEITEEEFERYYGKIFYNNTCIQLRITEKILVEQGGFVILFERSRKEIEWHFQEYQGKLNDDCSVLNLQVPKQ